MREILFRGKDTQTGKWRYSMTISKHFYNDDEIFSYYIASGNNTIDGKTLGQFTGLTDRNGKKIFEGDIVIMDKNAVIVKGLVKYQGAAFYIATNSDLWDIDNYYTLEVIGNKYDDPMILAELDYEE